MRKLLALILILALTVPAAALAYDDQIVKAWYFYYDKNVTPEMAASFGEYDNMLTIYFFMEDGTITSVNCNVQNKTGETSYLAAGKWEKDGDNYKYSIIGVGQGRCFIENDDLLLQLKDSLYMRLRSLTFYSPYEDYVIK